MASFAPYRAVTCLLFLGVHAALDFQQKCLQFTPEVHIYNSTRQVLEYVSAGVNLTFPDNDPTCTRPSQAVSVDLCRVALTISTSQRSSVTFELWLPEIWSGRILGTGNGGIDGCKYMLSLITSIGFFAMQDIVKHRGLVNVSDISSKVSSTKI